MEQISTSWTKATQNVSEALMGLVSAINAGKNAWIEMRKNGDQAFPIQRVNPLLDDVRNWTMAYGVPRNEKDIETHRFVNAVERDLTLNYTALFGDEASAEHYYQTGELTEGNFKGMGYCHAVKMSDATEYRKKSDGYQYGYWATFWKPKEGISYYVVDESIENVFVVCTNNETIHPKMAYQRASEFLAQLASAN